MLSLKSVMITLNVLAFTAFSWFLGQHTGEQRAQAHAQVAHQNEVRRLTTQIDALSEAVIQLSAPQDLRLVRFTAMSDARPPQKPNFVIAEYSDDELCLAINLYHEARGEGQKGQILAGQTTQNRVGMRASWRDLCDVVFSPSQFSWTLEQPYMDLSQPAERQALRDMLGLARQLVAGRIPDLSYGATHYYNPNKVTPSWQASYQEVAMIDGHRFMRCDPTAGGWC